MNEKTRGLEGVTLMKRKALRILFLALILSPAPGPQFLVPNLYAACSGLGLSWNCSAGSSISDVQTAINSAPDGATITFAPGSYSWSSWAQFSNAKGVTLICASQGACVVNFSGTVLGMNGTLSGTNTRFYRISGFTFQNNAGPDFIIWFYGAGEMSHIRIDHNTFSNLAEGTYVIVFGETSSIAHYYGVIDHNTVTAPSTVMFFHAFGATNHTPPASPLGTVNNIFIEDNSITIATMTNAGAGCMDAWGSDAAIVWRHNTTVNCLVTSHGVVHNGGPQNLELYANNLRVDAGAASAGFASGYRLFHHQGSGEFVAFNNTFTPYSGRNSDALAMTHYRSADSTAAGYGDPPGRCDGTKSIDGNRTPTSTYYGYPCWRQPGRDFAGNLMPIYVWNNKWSDTGGKIDMTVENPWGAANPSVDDHIKANRDYYNAVSASDQTSPTSPFNGTTGMGFGTLANRPTTCTTGSEAADAGKGGVGYFATDQGPQGTLYRCAAANTWTLHYTPYTYPHPLILAGGGDTNPPSAPSNLKIR
jgi:hypothetical protein